MSTRELWKRFPTIESQLPIELANGSVVEEIGTTCADCGHMPVTQKSMHGEVELTALGVKVRMISRCILCGKFSFMSGDVLMEGGRWYLAFPLPNTPMVNPWTGEVIPMVRRSVA